MFIIDLKTGMIPFKKKTVLGEDDEEDEDDEGIMPVVDYELIDNSDLIYIGHNKD